MSRSDLKILAIAGALLFGATLAFGGSSTIVVKDGNGISRTYDVVTDGSGNFVGMFGLCYGTAAAQCAAVKAASTAPASTDPAVIVAISSNTGEVGTPATGVSQPSGGVGISGWLSGIYNKLSRSICVTGTFWQATQPVSAASLRCRPAPQRRQRSRRSFPRLARRSRRAVRSAIRHSVQYRSRRPRPPTAYRHQRLRRSRPIRSSKEAPVIYIRSKSAPTQRCPPRMVGHGLQRHQRAKRWGSDAGQMLCGSGWTDIGIVCVARPRAIFDWNHHRREHNGMFHKDCQHLRFYQW